MEAPTDPEAGRERGVRSRRRVARVRSPNGWGFRCALPGRDTDPLLFFFLVCLAVVSVLLLSMPLPDGQSRFSFAALESVKVLLQQAGPGGNGDDDDFLRQIHSEADFAVAQGPPNSTLVPAAAETMVAVGGQAKTLGGTSSLQDPGLSDLLGGMYIPSTIGSYDLAATCAQTLTYLRDANRRLHMSWVATDDAVGDDGRWTRPHHSHRLRQALAQARDNSTNLVIITFASLQHHALVMNWLAHMAKLNINNILILSLDSQSTSLLSLKGHPGVLLQLSTSEALANAKLPLSALRFHIFTYSLCAGVNVILSDIDAIWIRNPIQQYMLHTADDCVFSGDGMPGTLRDKWGVATTASFALFFCRSNERTIALAAAGLSHLNEREDEQGAINYALDTLGFDVGANHGLIADPPLPQKRNLTIYDYYGSSYHSVTATPIKLMFTILARTIVTRHCSVSFHATTWSGQVAHCIVRQDVKEKESMLRLKGLWRLP